MSRKGMKMEVRIEDLDKIYNQVQKKDNTKLFALSLFGIGMFIMFLPYISTTLHEFTHAVFAVLTGYRIEGIVINPYTGKVILGGNANVISDFITFTSSIWGVPLAIFGIMRLLRRLNLPRFLLSGILIGYHIEGITTGSYSSDVSQYYPVFFLYLMLTILGYILVLIEFTKGVDHGNARHGVGSTPNGPGRRIK